MRKVIGILAHVDAGKTTLSEQLLFRAGAIRHAGRVDHGDAFLDDHPIERERGITVFSGLACFETGGDTVYWLDTPGHADFSAEMERAVSVMDAAVLMVSCADGVQSHTETVWGLLKDYHVPTILFLSKTDRPGADQQAVMEQVRSRLTTDLADIRSLQQTGALDDAGRESLAMLDDTLAEQYLADEWNDEQALDILRSMTSERRCFPVLCGSGLTGEGVDGLLRLLPLLTETHWEEKVQMSPAGRCFRVRREESGTRLCFVKLESGTLRVRDLLPDGQRITGMRVYHGARFHSVPEASAGDIVALIGPEGLGSGDVFGGIEKHRPTSLPMMAADLIWDNTAIPSFRLMELLYPIQDEEPTLRFEEHGGSISCRVMGKIQLEILKRLIPERCGVTVDFGPCRVIYRETIDNTAIGVGHYEPLRHYAEVVLRLSPGKRGSGITFISRCHVDTLALNWQRLIETHLFERPYAGVLTGAELTDVQVELLAGRASLKHTEGGDFRQAVGRGMRNGLMYAHSILLEPVASFTVTCPKEMLGPVTASLSRVKAELQPSEEAGSDTVRLQGECPLSVMMAWHEDFAALTHGRGTLRYRVEKEAPCLEQDSVVEKAAYNPLAEDTPDSVFCSHGAGTGVGWEHVREWAHCLEGIELLP